MRILVVRPDKIGDLVLSTPVFAALREKFPDAEIYALVRDTTLPIVARNPFLTGVIAYQPTSAHSGWAGFWRLTKELRALRFELAITLQVSFAVTAAVTLAGIRRRIGPYSKWYSFFAFNRGRKQHRSSVERHEADYNLMLLREVGIETASRRFEPTVIVDAEAEKRMRAFLRGRKIGDGEAFVIIHPGMGGSALNWPEERYGELAGRLAAEGVTVIVSGAESEKALVERVVERAMLRLPRRPVECFVGAVSPTGLSDMLALLSLCRVMVAPSTGPLHVAAALGKRTVSFYPPIKVQSAFRWGPYSADEKKHSVLVPKAPCGEHFSCAGERCRFYFCMEQVTVDEAAQSVLHQLDAAAARGKI